VLEVPQRLEMRQYGSANLTLWISFWDWIRLRNHF